MKIKTNSIYKLNKEIIKSQPGDIFILKNGTYQSKEILFKAFGTKDKPIILKAENPGKVIITGESSIIIKGENLILSGFKFINI